MNHAPHLRKVMSFIFFNEEHLSTNCPYKDGMDLKLCTKCGVGEHILEECPLMLEKLSNKMNIHILSGVPKH